MFANDAKNNARVWVRIGQGESTSRPRHHHRRPGGRPAPHPERREGRPADRPQQRGRHQPAREREPVDGRPATYMVERPEALIALSPRETAIPAIDGADTMTQKQVLIALRAAVSASLAALTPTPATSKVEEEAARYLNMPALATA